MLIFFIYVAKSK